MAIKIPFDTYLTVCRDPRGGWMILKGGRVHLGAGEFREPLSLAAAERIAENMVKSKAYGKVKLTIDTRSVFNRNTDIDLINRGMLDIADCIAIPLPS